MHTCGNNISLHGAIIQPVVDKAVFTCVSERITSIAALVIGLEDLPSIGRGCRFKYLYFLDDVVMGKQGVTVGII